MNRLLASRYTSWPPRTEPVKLTYPISGRAMMRAQPSWSACTAVTNPSGAPAAAKARSNASPQSAVRMACLISTASPASTAGTTTFTVMSRG